MTGVLGLPSGIRIKRIPEGIIVIPVITNGISICALENALIFRHLFNAGILKVPASALPVQ